MNRLAATFILGAFVYPILADVVHYDESIGGDLDWTSEALPAFNNGDMEIFDLEVGINSVSGSTSLIFCRGCDNTDNDQFAINLRPGLQLDSAIVSHTLRGSPIEAIWVYADITEPDWSTTCSNVCNTFTLGDGVDIDLSSIGLPMTGSTIFSNNGHNGDPFADGYIDYAFLFSVSAVAEPVTIDIKPGSDPNCFNANGHGVIPVAVLGSDTFDVTNIDQGSLLFGGLEVRIRGNKGPLCGLEYSNGDAYLDLVCHFEDDADSWEPGEGEATLTGSLFDLTEFEGTDSICVVP